MAMDGQVLASTGVTFMGAQTENDWDVFGLVAGRIVVRACGCLELSNICIADFPEHFNILIMTNSHFTYLATDTVIIPPMESCSMVNSTFKVKLRSTDFSVNESLLITLKILKDMLGMFWVEHNLSNRCVVDYRRLQVKHNWSVAFEKSDLAVFSIFTLHLLILTSNVRCLD